MNLIKWLSVLVLFIALLSLACGDDDDSSDDDSVDDDTDDDDSVDDDTTDDDSTDDDDDDDDDTSPDDDTGDDDGEATELLVIGEDGNGAGFSLRRQSDGWLRENFPAQGIANSFLGPSFFLAGRTGWQAINVAYSLTLDYRLLVYDPQNGWSLDAAHLPQQDSFNVSALFAPEADNLWAATASFTFGNFIFALLSYVDGEPTAIAPATNGYMFMDFTRPDNGYFIGTYWMEAAIVGYWNGQTMSRLEVPAGYEEGLFWSLMTVGDNESLIFLTEGEWLDSTLLHLQNGQWSVVGAPAGCADPGTIIAFSYGHNRDAETGYAIVPTYRQGKTDALWECRAGQWSCREPQQSIHVVSSLVLRDGRVFVLGTSAGNAVLYEVLADRLEEVELPNVDLKPRCLQAIGPLAPKYNACNKFFLHQ
ncbi:MAG TPA: hypothetical protein PKW95_17285 [bacterium]|nr:hypothetical protein [bacterium]